MANYMLTGIDPETWKRFKAGCDLQGVTIKEALLCFIDTRDLIFQTQHDYHKANHDKPKTGRKKT